MSIYAFYSLSLSRNIGTYHASVSNRVNRSPVLSKIRIEGFEPASRSSFHPHSHARLCLHWLTSFKNILRYPPLSEILFELRHLRQTACRLDRRPHSLLLVLCPDPLLDFSTVVAVREGWNDEASRFFAHDLQSCLAMSKRTGRVREEG